MKTPTHRKAGGPLAVGGRHETPLGAAEPARPPKSKRERVMAIVEAIEGSLDENNPGHFTDDGVPQITAIEAVLGWRPEGAERDSAWSTIQAA